MHKNGLVKFTAILFTVISILQISYTYVVSKIEKDAKIQYSEISEEFVSGNVAYFEHTSERGYQRILSVHMVSDGDVIWNGQFSGSKELFKEAMNIFKTMKPQSE